MPITLRQQLHAVPGEGIDDRADYIAAEVPMAAYPTALVAVIGTGGSGGI